MHIKFPVTVHLLLIRLRKVLLLRRHATGYMDGYYSLPAGHLDGGETIRLAGVREAREEIGVEIDPPDMTFACVFHRHEDEERVDFFLHVHKWDGNPVNAEPRKCDDVRWVDIDSLPLNTIPYIKRAIEDVQEGIMYEEFGWRKE
jgi:8-oxo-dGTP pyrophosphatase MutT (NUDIX family)